MDVRPGPLTAVVPALLLALDRLSVFTLLLALDRLSVFTFTAATQDDDCWQFV